MTAMLHFIRRIVGRPAARHLGEDEFVDVLEGTALPAGRTAHLGACLDCASTLESMAPLYRDIAGGGIYGATDDGLDAELARVDWSRLRSGVRDRLLGRAVRRSSLLPRWTAGALTPAAARALTPAALALLLSGAAGGWWHYRTAHVPSPVSVDAARTGLEPGPAAVDLFGDAETLEAEALAWSDVEIFTALNELEASEEEALRELIAMAVGENGGPGSGLDR